MKQFLKKVLKRIDKHSNNHENGIMEYTLKNLKLEASRLGFIIDREPDWIRIRRKGSSKESGYTAWDIDDAFCNLYDMSGNSHLNNVSLK